MSLNLSRPTETPWLHPERYWPDLTAATAHLDPPIGAISLAALSHNAFDMLDRANGTPIRVATKSVRVRAVIDAVLALPGYSGVLAYSLAEAVWLAETIVDVVVGYPTAKRAALLTVGRSAKLASRITLMVDSIAHLDYIDSVIAPGQRETLRVALELDASFTSPVLGRLGVWRSPVHSPDDAAALAHAVVARKGFQLVGMMAYESQIAGVGDRPPGQRLRGMVIERMQTASMAELQHRRAEAVAAVRSITDLEFVNGGGTGSLELTSSDRSVTEIGAGSGLFAGHIFDHYSRFTPAPAAAFALPVVRKPTEHDVAILGGGWVASGPPGSDRLPQIAWPAGLLSVKREALGEVQTPLTGGQASALHVGDRVWLRHAKSGELSEHLNAFHVIDGGEVVTEVPTYRGEGKAFL